MTKKDVKISIDIGKKGGYCLYSPNDGIIGVGEIDTSSIDGIFKLDELIDTHDIVEVVFERPFAINGNKNFNTLVNYGLIKSSPMRKGIRIKEITPKEWIQFYKSIKSNKKLHSKMAYKIISRIPNHHLLFPHLEREDILNYLIKKDGVADAILLARYEIALSIYSV